MRIEECISRRLRESRPPCLCFQSLEPRRSISASSVPKHCRKALSCRAEGRSNLFASSLDNKQLRISTKRILRQLSSLELALGELAAIAALSGLGSLIKQNEAAEYYIRNFPEGSLFDFHLVWALQLDRIYTANYFLALLALLSASLAACSVTRQWPMVKVARRWRLAGSPQRVAAAGSEENAVTLPDADLTDLGKLLRGRGYAVFLKEGSLYAFKGLAGKFAPIGVHISMLLLIAGVAFGGLGGLSGSVMIPEDGDFVLAEALQPRTVLARPHKDLSRAKLHVDNFEINYRPDGSVGQFTSKVTLGDTSSGQTIEQTTIAVNHPLRYKGFTAYQTDWSIAAVTLRVKGPGAQSSEEPAPFNLPVANLEGESGVNGKLWATFLPSEAPGDGAGQPKGVSLVMRDMQTVAFYDADGVFAGIRRPGSGNSINVAGLEILVDHLVGSTGLELKVDPGVPYVYAGFAGLMITTAISYLSHSQVWALQQEKLLHISGMSNRAKFAFQQEMAAVVEQIPERL